MWDDAQALRKLYRTLFGISLALVLFGVLHYALHLPVFAPRAVYLENVPVRVPLDMVEEVVHRDMPGNFFTANLDRTRQAFEQLPWVRKASVRRHFPWQLDVAIEEHVALAHWNGSQLINVQGEVFKAQSGEPLPDFSGPDEAAAEVAQKYRRFGEMLAPLGEEIAQISLSQRLAWRVRLKSGTELELGREQVEERMARFVAAYPQSVGALKRPVNYVDMRYRNGFAVRVAG
jgi:cell division protein FtsQ